MDDEKISSYWTRLINAKTFEEAMIILRELVMEVGNERID